MRKDIPTFRRARLALILLILGQQCASADGDPPKVTEGAPGQITVHDKAGRPVTAFHLEFLRWHPDFYWYPGDSGENKFFWTSQESMDVIDGSGLAHLPQLTPGNWILRCDAAGYARAHSKKFSIADSRVMPPPLEIVMGQGGSLSGTIVDASHEPIKGVAVQTHDTRFRADNGFYTLSPPPVDNHADRSTVTDSLGRFTLKNLSSGDYQLQLDHPLFERRFVFPFAVEDEEETQIPTVRMKRGCLYGGSITEGGVPSPGAKIEICRVDEQGGREDDRGHWIWDKVYADKLGIYRGSRPLPPGRYLFAVTPHLSNQENPLLPILYVKERIFFHRLTRGKPNRIDLDIPKRP